MVRVDGWDGSTDPRTAGRDRAATPRIVWLGRVSWAVIGIVLVATTTVAALAAISELVLPLIFAVMLGIVFHPVASSLGRRMPPAAAAALVVFSLAALVVVVVLAVAAAVVAQLDQLAEETDLAVVQLSEPFDDAGLGAGTPQRARAELAELGGFIRGGLLTAVVGGIDATVGFVSGSVLGLFLMYYVLKDGPTIRDRGLDQVPAHLRSEAADFVAAAVRSTGAFWAARGILSAVVTVVVVVAAAMLGLPMVATLGVVTFVGGFVPYIGAFLGGGLATLLALADGGFAPAALMLVIVMASNIGLENLLEPRVMSGRLAIHPMLVLVATTAGGVLGGLVGLVLAVPLTVIGLDLLARVRRVWALDAGGPVEQGRPQMSPRTIDPRRT